MVFSQFLVLPVVPFITKFNRYIVLGLLVVGKFGNNFKAIPDGFSKEKGNYIYKDRNGISQLELDSNKEYHVGYAGGSGVFLGRYGAGLPGGGALQSELGDLGEQREGISRGSEACRCIERHLEWQDYL